MKKLNVVLAGLRFGGSFVDIYCQHPNVGTVGIFDTDTELTAKMAKVFKIDKIYNSFEEILKDEAVDAVHLITPIPLHEEQTVQVLESGKHCACTVPMAISLEGIQRITDAVRKTGKKYMMMETTLYTYQFFYVKELIKSGNLGKLQFLRGSHYQDMINWPDYWMGLPPMYYGTHAIGPLVALAGSHIKKVHCFGSGTMADWMTKCYNNPYPVESAIFSFENGMKAEATRTLFETARTYQEGLFVYGSKACFEWGFCDNDAPYLTTTRNPANNDRGSISDVEIVDLPNYHEYLPEEIRHFTVGENYDPLNPQNSLQKGAGAGHHGSHAHLVHEFVSSVVEDRKPYIDEILGGNITAAGICAHESAMKDGEAVIIPEF